MEEEIPRSFREGWQRASNRAKRSSTPGSQSIQIDCYLVEVQVKVEVVEVVEVEVFLSRFIIYIIFIYYYVIKVLNSYMYLQQLTKFI